MALGLCRLPGDEGAEPHRKGDNVRTIRRVATSTVLLWAFLVAASVAMACPICHTETGKKVRAGIFNDEFGSNAAMTLLPFPVLISLVALIHFGPPAWLTASRRGPHESTHR
jgi:hypothetical protein